MAIHDTIDAASALRQYLLSNSYVSDEVGTRVYVRQIPRGTAAPGKAIVLIQVGGVPATRLPIVDTEFQIRCYGGTSVEAREVYRGLRSALHFARRQKIEPGVGVGSGDNWLVSAREVSGASDLREPETEWEFVLCRFSCVFVTFPVEE